MSVLACIKSPREHPSAVAISHFHSVASVLLEEKSMVSGRFSTHGMCLDMVTMSGSGAMCDGEAKPRRPWSPADARSALIFSFLIEFAFLSIPSSCRR
jgi:hypothetical protein